MNRNEQPAEPVLANAPHDHPLFEHPLLDIVKIWETIQGEGPNIGEPCVFIRLAGCNLRCNFCDTDYTTDRHQCGADVILDHIRKKFHRHIKLLVLTGGEPFRQPIGPFIREACARGFRVQIETNGTIYRNDIPWELTEWGQLQIVCSPKTPLLSRELEDHITAFKYVLDEHNVCPNDGLPSRTLMSARPARPSNPHIPIYVQPMDAHEEEQNARNIAAALGSCFTFGYRFSYQVHKAVGLE